MVFTCRKKYLEESLIVVMDFSKMIKIVNNNNKTRVHMMLAMKNKIGEEDFTTCRNLVVAIPVKNLFVVCRKRIITTQINLQEVLTSLLHLLQQ